MLVAPLKDCVLKTKRKANNKSIGDNFLAMVYVKYVIRKMFQKTYVIRDLKENGLVIRDRDNPTDPPPPLYHPDKLRIASMATSFLFL